MEASESVEGGGRLDSWYMVGAVLAVEGELEPLM